MLSLQTVKPGAARIVCRVNGNLPPSDWSSAVIRWPSPTLGIGRSVICASQTGPGSSDVGVRVDETGTGGDGGDGPPDNGDDNSNRNNDDNGDDGEEYLNLQQAEELAAAKGVRLPEDYAAAARDGGLKLSVLRQYIVISSGSLLTGLLARSLPAFRDRLIADRMYFFKILAEISIDSGECLIENIYMDKMSVTQGNN